MTIKISFSALFFLGVITFATAAPSHAPILITQKAKTEFCPINSVCFAIDHSGSISPPQYVQELKFVGNIATEISKRSTNTLYSAYGFSSGSFLMQSSTKDLKGEFLPKVLNFKKITGGTKMRQGMQNCFDEIKGNGGNRLIVLITDGSDRSKPDALSIAPTIKSTGISIVTVGIGNKIEEQYLKDIASGPGSFIKSDDFSSLLKNVIDVVEHSCKVVSSPKPKPSKKPSKKPKKPKRKGGDGCARAYRNCGFAFEGKRKVPTFSVTGKPDVAFTSLIVSRTKGEKLGVLNTNGIVPEFISKDGSSRPITSFASPPFTPTHFKPLTIAGHGSMDGSGIGHQTYHGDQEMLARHRCIRVWFTTYQVFTGKNPPQVNNINVDKSDKKCVVFKSK